MENRAGEFTVEAIRAKREEKGSTYFFIKWLGYPEYENTWEPVEHLTGCRALVEAFLRDHETKEATAGKKSTKKRETQSAKCSSSNPKSHTKRRKTDSAVSADKKTGKGKVLFDKEESMKSEDGFEYNEAVAYEKTRRYIEFDIATKLPRDRSPKRLVHVTVLDGKITYLVQWKNEESHEDNKEEDVNADNTSMVDGSTFRTLYPQLIIKFYESRLISMDPIDDELLAERACAAMVSAKERNENVEVDNESGDDEIKNSNAPIKDLIDKFGLPMNLESSESSSISSNSASDSE